MPDIPNVVGHVVGPLVWLVFIALIAWYGVWGAVVERREQRVASPPGLRIGDSVMTRRGRSFSTRRVRLRRRVPATGPRT